MTTRRFGKRLSLLLAMTTVLAAPAAHGQDAEPAPKAAKLIQTGDVLSGELNAMRVRSGSNGKRVAMYQIQRAAPAARPDGSLRSRDRSRNLSDRHQQRRAGGAVEKFRRQGSLGESRRGYLLAASRADERRRGHQMECGDEALKRPDRAEVRSQTLISNWSKCPRFCSHASRIRLGTATMTQMTKNSGQPTAFATYPAPDDK